MSSRRASRCAGPPRTPHVGGAPCRSFRAITGHGVLVSFSAIPAVLLDRPAEHDHAVVEIDVRPAQCTQLAPGAGDHRQPDERASPDHARPLNEACSFLRARRPARVPQLAAILDTRSGITAVQRWTDPQLAPPTAGPGSNLAGLAPVPRRGPDADVLVTPFNAAGEHLRNSLPGSTTNGRS